MSVKLVGCYTRIVEMRDEIANHGFMRYFIIDLLIKFLNKVEACLHVALTLRTDEIQNSKVKTDSA